MRPFVVAHNTPIKQQLSQIFSEWLTPIFLCLEEAENFTTHVRGDSLQICWWTVYHRKLSWLRCCHGLCMPKAPDKQSKFPAQETRMRILYKKLVYTIRTQNHPNFSYGKHGGRQRQQFSCSCKSVWQTWIVCQGPNSMLLGLTSCKSGQKSLNEQKRHLIWFESRSRSSNLSPIKTAYVTSYYWLIVMPAVSHTRFHRYDDIFFKNHLRDILLCHLMPWLGMTPCKYANEPFITKKLDTLCYLPVKTASS